MPNVSLKEATGGLPAEEKGVGAKPMERVASALHDMCQPLMMLQCRLEIGSMIATPEGYEEVVRECLTECDRLLRSVDVLRGEVLRGLEGEKPA